MLQLAVILLLVGSGVVLLVLEAQRDSRSDAERQVLTLSQGLAQLPEVRSAFIAPDPPRTLRPLAESVRGATGTDFLVFMAQDRTR